jgi:hypothetical protein
MFDYEGHPRIVEPYCHGQNRQGQDMLRAIQVGGTTASGRRSFGFGKLWILAKATNIRLSDVHFLPSDPHYNPHDTAMAEIHCRV